VGLGAQDDCLARQEAPLWRHESPAKALWADLGAQVRDREHPLIRLGLARSRPGRAQYLRGRGHKGRVVGHGRLQANGFRDGLRAVFLGFTMGGVSGNRLSASIFAFRALIKQPLDSTMPDSLHDLATHISNWAVEEGPLNDNCVEAANKLMSLARLLHAKESPEADEEIGEAVHKLIEAFPSPNIERAGFAAKLCGALLEEQLISSGFEEPLNQIIEAAIPGALAFDAKLTECLMGEDEYDTAMGAANKTLPSEGCDWARFENFHLPALSVFASSPEARSRAAKRWLSDLSKFQSSAAAHWLVRMLKTLHRERILVIEPIMNRAFEALVSDVSSNFELHDMLAMLMWENRFSKTPGFRRFAEMLRPVPQAGRGVWNLYNWTSVREGRLPDASDQSNHAHWIWGEGCPADITEFEGLRVVLLGPPTYPRGWNAGQELPQLRPELEIQRWLDPIEIKEWMNRFGKASAAVAR